MVQLISRSIHASSAAPRRRPPSPLFLIAASISISRPYRLGRPATESASHDRRQRAGQRLGMVTSRISRIAVRSTKFAAQNSKSSAGAAGRPRSSARPRAPAEHGRVARRITPRQGEQRTRLVHLLGRALQGDPSTQGAGRGAPPGRGRRRHPGRDRRHVGRKSSAPRASTMAFSIVQSHLRVAIGVRGVHQPHARQRRRVAPSGEAAPTRNTASTSPAASAARASALTRLQERRAVGVDAAAVSNT